MTPGLHPGGPSVVDRLSGLEPANWPAAQDLGLLLIGPQKPGKAPQVPSQWPVSSQTGGSLSNGWVLRWREEGSLAPGILPRPRVCL